MRLPSTPRRGYLILWWILQLASVLHAASTRASLCSAFRADYAAISIRCKASASSFQGLLTSESSAHRDTHRQAAKEPLLPQHKTRSRGAGAVARPKGSHKEETTHKVSTLRALPRASGRYWCGRRPGGAFVKGFSRDPHRRGAAARVGGSRFTPTVPVESRRAGRACSRTSRRRPRRVSSARA